MIRGRGVALLALAAVPAATSAQDVVAITNVTVISMADTTPLRGRTVILRNGRIATIAPATTTSPPAGARVVDGDGKYLIPGLFDMHVHTSKSRASALPMYVAHGVTTVRDMGSEHAEVLRWRREIRAGSRVGPRMLIAGPYLESLRNIERMRRDPPEERVEPFERARIAIGSPQDARRVVDSLAGLELDFLKVRTVQDDASYLALGAAADARGLRLVGHEVGSSPRLLLRARQDGIDHPLRGPAGMSARERRSFWRELAARDVGVVPTLIVIPESVLRPAKYFDRLVGDSTAAVHPMRPYLSRFLVLDWREQAAEQSWLRRRTLQGYWPQIIQQVREMRAAGVRIMTGTDVAVLNIFPGYSLHQELEFFVDSIGMSPAEALLSATRRPAEWLGLADSVGTVEAGRIADLVLLEGNPLESIRNTRRIAAVVLRGRLFDQSGLDSLRAGVRAMPDLRVNDWLRSRPQEPPGGLEVMRVADGVFAAVRREPLGLAVNSNSLIVVGDSAVLVVDAQFTRLATLETIREIRRLTRRPVRWVVNTHWHDDHFAGNQVYRDSFPGVQFIIHENTRADLRVLGAPNRAGTRTGAPPLADKFERQLVQGLGIDSTPVVPGERESMTSAIRIMRQYLAEQPDFRETMDGPSVTDELRLTLGRHEVRVRWPGPGNTRGDLVVWLPRSGVIATGDLVVAPIPFAFGSYPSDWISALDAIAALRPAVIVPGHGPVMRDLSYLTRVRGALSAIRDSAAAVLARGDSASPAFRRMNFEAQRTAFTGGDPWLTNLFGRFFLTPAYTSAVQRERERRAK